MSANFICKIEYDPIKLSTQIKDFKMIITNMLYAKVLLLLTHNFFVFIYFFLFNCDGHRKTPKASKMRLPKSAMMAYFFFGC